MYFSEEVTNDIALNRAIEEIKEKKDKVKIKDSVEKGKQVIYLEIGEKKFFGKGDTKSLAVKSVTEKIKKHKPALIKRQFGKLMKNVKKGFKGN